MLAAAGVPELDVDELVDDDDDSLEDEDEDSLDVDDEVSLVEELLVFVEPGRLSVL